MSFVLRHRVALVRNKTREILDLVYRAVISRTLLQYFYHIMNLDAPKYKFKTYAFASMTFYKKKYDISNPQQKSDIRTKELH